MEENHQEEMEVPRGELAVCLAASYASHRRPWGHRRQTEGQGDDGGRHREVCQKECGGECLEEQSHGEWGHGEHLEEEVLPVRSLDQMGQQEEENEKGCAPQPLWWSYG